MSEAYWINKIENKPNFKLGQNFLVDTNISRKITKLVIIKKFGGGVLKSLRTN